MSSQDSWTCSDCTEGANGLAAFTTTDSAIAGQVDLFIAELCPQFEDVELCVEKMPGFWPEVARTILPVHWIYICADLECREEKVRVFIVIVNSLYSMCFLKGKFSGK